MEKYSEYKDSGVQWLGEIPSHWKIRRIKWLFREEDEKNVNLTYQLLSFSRNKGIIPFSAINEKAPSASDLSKYKVLHEGQLLENRMQAWSGMFGCSHIEGCVSPDYSVFSPYDSNVVTEYYACLFRTPIFVQQFANASKGIGDGFNRLYTPQFHKIYAIVPSTIEQHAIVSYLDTKCSKLDTFISNKEKEITLLQEIKLRVITDAVTRGLNPNVKFKPTNIPWLPEIPEYWKIKRAKNMFKKEQRPIQDDDEIVTCFRDGEVTLRKNRRTSGFTEATDYSHYQHICKGDLVIHQMDAFAGSSGVSDSDGMGTPVLSVCTPKIEGIDNYYYAHVLRIMGKNGFILSLYRGIRERSSDFRFDTFIKQWLPVPPIEEQHAIVSYITERVAKIDSLVEKLNKEIECIKEYKQRLISDVVTGQIKVS